MAWPDYRVVLARATGNWARHFKFLVYFGGLEKSPVLLNFKKKNVFPNIKVMKHATHKHVSTANKQLDKWTNSALNARTRTTRLTRFSKIVSTFTTFSGRCTIWAQSAGTQVSSRHCNDRNNLITLCWSVFTNFQIYLKRQNSGRKNSLKWHPNHRPRFQFGADLETESFVIGCFFRHAWKRRTGLIRTRVQNTASSMLVRISRGI